MISKFDHELLIALEAVRQAAIVCRSVQSAITPESLAKKDDSPVTVADFASQALICRRLQQAFPEDPVIGEEGSAELRTPDGANFLQQIMEECSKAGVTASDKEICNWIDRGSLHEFRPRFWTLDPIDGTKGFLRNEQYAISLALIIDGQIQIGILGCPNMHVHSSLSAPSSGVLAWAVRGCGSWQQSLNQPDISPTRISTTDTAATQDARFCESVESGHSSHDWSGQIAAELGIHREPFRIDSQCKYLAVARGDADLYLRLPTRKGYQEKIWDHAGGVLIVEEAGGKVTDIRGKVPDFAHGSQLSANIGMVVTNGRLHASVVQAVMRFAPENIL